VALVVILQALIALLANAAIYSPPGEPIGAGVMLDLQGLRLTIPTRGRRCCPAVLYNLQAFGADLAAAGRVFGN
jgi:hypothetical protein